MGLISFSEITDGNTANAADVNTPLNTIYDEVNGNLQAVNIADDAIVSAKIANDAVTSDKIDDSAVLTAAINDDAVTTAKLAAGAVTPAKTSAMNRQDNTTNTTITAPKIQTGWGYITGSGSRKQSESVTFADAFSSEPIVYISYLGFHTNTGGNATAITDFDDGTGGSYSQSPSAQSISTTGFTAEISTENGNTLASTGDFGYSWIAIGPA